MPVLQLSRDGAVGIITINEPPVNVLSVNVRKALLEGFAAMRADPDIEAIVLVCGGRTFIAGFDISEFDGGLQEPHLQRVLDAVEHVGKPTVAAIHGTALGGGFELAMLCSHRIAVPSAAVGLPEVKIGLMPGAGGTQRLPRVVGPELALDLMLSGRSVGGAEALKLGLIDCLAKEGQLEADAITFAGRIIEANGPLPRISDRQELVDPFRGRSEFFAAYRESRAAEFRGFNAHEAIISAVEAAVELPIAEGLQCERELCNALVETRQSLAQRHAFFAERRAAKIPGELLSGETRRIVSIRIHGNGEGAEAAARYFAGSRVPVGKFDPAGCEAGGTYLIVVTGNAGLPHCIPSEAIVVLTEDFAMLDDYAAKADVPENVLGLKLRSDGRRLAEVVRGQRSDPASLGALVDLLRRSGKVPVLCTPSPGLVRDRLLATLRGGAEQLREEGVAASLIDGALYDYGFRSGLLFGDVDAISHALNQTGMDGLIERLLAPVVEEGRRLIAEGIVQRASDIDIAAIHGLDWPIYTGGPMFWNATCSGEPAMTG
ncbi:MAG: enoyl-CoA hydratase/isomerase family protein [Betaproteobacteria bacterium]|nr:enoyl-CoA hydratase/isomerase family protein [Betaproteobacteria bacterium]